MNAHDLVTWVILVGMVALWIDIKGRHDDN